MHLSNIFMLMLKTNKGLQVQNTVKESRKCVIPVVCVKLGEGM